MMLTEDQVMVQDMTRRFATERLAPFSAEWDRTKEFPRDRIREMGELGLMGMLVPEDYDGAKTDHIAYAPGAGGSGRRATARCPP